MTQAFLWGVAIGFFCASIIARFLFWWYWRSRN